MIVAKSTEGDVIVGINEADIARMRQGLTCIKKGGKQYGFRELIVFTGASDDAMLTLLNMSGGPERQDDNPMHESLLNDPDVVNAAGFADIADLDEDQRIDMIGRMASPPPHGSGRTVTVIVDSVAGKADRYVRKLAQRYPNVKEMGRAPGPVEKTTIIKVGPIR